MVSLIARNRKIFNNKANFIDSVVKEKAKDKLVNLPLAVGTIMAERFKILKVLGKGSFGVVY